MSTFWSPTWGLGQLDYQPDLTTFTPDSGAPALKIRWKESRTGQADKRSAPRRKADLEEWFAWLTFTSLSGEAFSFRRGGPPPGTAP